MGRTSEQGKNGNAGLIPAPVPRAAWLRPEDTEGKRDLDRIAVLAILMRLLIGAQNMKVKIS
jgi:hypothetical protein